MKELTFKIKQLFIGTRVLENYLKYQLLCGACALIHFVFTILFCIGEVYTLATVNIFSTLLYVVCGLILATKEIYRTLFLIAFFEVEINSAVSSILLGDGYEFMIYTLALIPGAFYMAYTWPSSSKNTYGISALPHVSSLIIGLLYLVVEFMYSVVPPKYSSNEILKIKPIFHYFNITISVMVLLIFSILFAFEVRYIMGMVSDENSRLGEIASKDPLTKALNRRSLTDLIENEIKEDNDVKFGLILLDIDDFKKINDTYGHSVGDQVLMGIADIMRSEIRENDYLCRWGGEEFILIIHGSEQEHVAAAERIRQCIEKQEFNSERTAFSVTATLGVSEYQTGLKLRTLVDMADQKMYYGKNHGKNMVVS